MLRYKVSPIIKGDQGTLCLGCSRSDLEQITYANLGRLSEQGSKGERSNRSVSRDRRWYFRTTRVR